jgi:hypothetical protein
MNQEKTNSNGFHWVEIGKVKIDPKSGVGERIDNPEIKFSLAPTQISLLQFLSVDGGTSADDICRKYSLLFIQNEAMLNATANHRDVDKIESKLELIDRISTRIDNHPFSAKNNVRVSIINLGKKIGKDAIDSIYPSLYKLSEPNDDKNNISGWYDSSRSFEVGTISVDLYSGVGIITNSCEFFQLSPQLVTFCVSLDDENFYTIEELAYRYELSQQYLSGKISQDEVLQNYNSFPHLAIYTSGSLVRVLICELKKIIGKDRIINRNGHGYRLAKEADLRRGSRTHASCKQC